MSKVLIIGAPFYPLPAVEGGAIETLVEEYLKHNSKTQKNKITVISPFSDKVDEEINKEYSNTKFIYIKSNNIPFIFYKILYAFLRRIIRRKQFPTAYAMSVIKYLKKNDELAKYDLVIIENQIESLIKYGNKINSKIVCHLHNDYLNVNTIQAQKIVNSCDEFWGVSNFICSQINKIDSNVATKTLYNGVDIEKYKIMTSIDDDFYKKITFDKNDFIILYVGRIMPEKGVLELIKAFNLAKDETDNMKLIVVGSKKNDTKVVNKYYEKLMEEQEKNKESIYFFGKANVEELRKLYTIAKLQVVPSMWEEAFGLIVVEGMCFNKPLIVSNSGGIPEIINNDVIIVDRKNIINELKNAIIEMYSNRNINDVKDFGYREIIKKFDIKNYCMNFEEFISKLNK